MAGTKISEATLREQLQGTENIPIVDADLPKGRTTVEKLKEYVQPDLSGYAKKTGAEFTGTIAAPIVAFMRESKGMMAAIQADSNNILFRTYNAGVGSITFQVQNSMPLKLTEAGIWENNQLLENKYAKITDLNQLATKTEVQDKLDTSTYTSDKATFATKTELGAKQDALVSGTNIKTINSQSLLGEGNIEITVEGGGISDAPSDGKLYGRKDAQWTEVVIPDTSNLATKDELSAKLDTATYNEEKATFALKTEIPDTSTLATKSELSDGLAGKANTSDLSNYLPTSYAQSTYATKSELGAKLDVETYNSDKATFALKSEIPDTSDFATKGELNAKVSTETYNSDKATFALKSEIPTDYATEEDIQKAISRINIEYLVMYGVEFDTTVSSPDCMRIGNPNLHRTLPVHSQMRGCLLNDDGEVTKYLNESDWTSETRDGSQGQVMVEVPEHYVKFETEGTKRRVKMSITPVVGYKKISRYYVSAYEATVQRSASKLSSVVNIDADYRGGNNKAVWDGTSRSLLGTPATSISRTNFRTYARNRKEGSTEWNCMTYDIQKDLYWLFVVEYATLNTQKAFNSAKTSEGYAQGGLGDGFTTLDWNKWTNFNSNNPVVPCGYTDELGNGTGQKEYSMPSEYDATIKKLYVPRYRGIENPFGHIWQWTDGINVRISPNAPTGDGLNKVYVCSDPSKFNDTGYDGYTYVGDEARTEAYVKEVIFREGGEIISSVVGGSSTTYFCDYHYTNIPNTETLRGVRFGGRADDGSSAGFVSAYSNRVPSAAYADIGSRLCFIPE